MRSLGWRAARNPGGGGKKAGPNQRTKPLYFVGRWCRSSLEGGYSSVPFCRGQSSLWIIPVVAVQNSSRYVKEM